MRIEETPVPPTKPRSWSERRYREVHDSVPQVVEVRNAAGEVTARPRACGPVSAYVMARSWQARGLSARVFPAAGGEV